MPNDFHALHEPFNAAPPPDPQTHPSESLPAAARVVGAAPNTVAELAFAVAVDQVRLLGARLLGGQVVPGIKVLSPDAQRIADYYLSDCTDPADLADPVGWLIAAHEETVKQLNELKYERSE